MNEYQPSNRYKALYEKGGGRELWDFLRKPENVFLAIAGAVSGRPPVEVIALDLKEKFGAPYFDDLNMRRMAGEICRFILTQFGFWVLGQTSISDKVIFSSGYRYERGERTIAKDKELFEQLLSYTIHQSSKSDPLTQVRSKDMESDVMSARDFFQKIGQDELSRRGILRGKGDKRLLQGVSVEPLIQLLIEQGISKIQHSDMWALHSDGTYLNRYYQAHSPRHIETLEDLGDVFRDANKKINPFYQAGWPQVAPISRETLSIQSSPQPLPEKPQVTQSSFNPSSRVEAIMPLIDMYKDGRMMKDELKNILEKFLA
jgi:hypothetical protein